MGNISHLIIIKSFQFSPKVLKWKIGSIRVELAKFTTKPATGVY